jgi:hypothetical protein
MRPKRGLKWINSQPHRRQVILHAARMRGLPETTGTAGLFASSWASSLTSDERNNRGMISWYVRHKH